MKEQLKRLEVILDEYLVKKAPVQLPEKARNVISDILPWIVIVFSVLMVPIVLGALGIGAIFAPFALLSGPTAGFAYFVTVLSSLIILVLSIMSISPLMKKMRRGWELSFYITLISALENLLTGNLFGLIIGTTLSLYILFQIRGLYK